MFKKQRQKIKKITLILIGIAVILPSFFVFINNSTFIKPADAQSAMCTYQTEGLTEPPYTRSINPRSAQVSISNSTVKDSAGLDIGIQGSVTVLYAAVTQTGQYQNSNTCQIQGFIEVLAPGILGVSAVSSKINLTQQTLTVKGNSIEITGKYSIPDLSIALSNSTAIRNTEQAQAYSLRFGATESSETYYPAGQNGSTQLQLVGCSNKTKVCVGSTVTDNELVAKLKDVKVDVGAIQSTSSGENFESIIPKDRRGKGVDQLQNFFRIYKGQSIGFGARVTPKAPTDKMLQTGATKFELTESSSTNGTSLKKLEEVFAGVYNPSLSYEANTNKIGCVKQEIISGNGYSYLGLGGGGVASYPWCNLVGKGSGKQATPIKMDGSQHILLGVNFSYQNLQEMFLTVKEIKCTSSKECEAESQANANLVTLVSGFDLERSAFSDLTAKGMFVSGGVDIAVAIGQKYLGLPITFNNGKFPIYIVVYPDKLTWDEFKDKETPSWVPQPQVATGSSAVQDSTAANSLYAFIVKIISVIVSWLQTIVYTIFAYILVPVINALLKIRPYEDVFVNIIYPGWLILRNLANIIFIISLLVIGLRILFQQSASGTAATFIRRLVIMALLVNFSLVIAQGVVAIADTVQSQFLPTDSKVIEALGNKLMVEPLKTFRTEVASETSDFTGENAQNALADTIKPLVLLILTVASFFAFAAIAALLAVRLVALWLLYMVSPIAYAGTLLDFTKKYANDWWSDFIKYTLLTPILAFILNIGALMAVVFSGQNNSLFKFSDSLTGDIIAGGLTVTTHFIVLLFLFAGMKAATTFGGAAGKTVVNYAKKGFDLAMKRAPKAGLDYLSDKAATKLGDKGYKGAASALSAITHPLQFGSAVKNKWIDEPGKDRKKRDAERITSIPGLTKMPLKGDVLKPYNEHGKEKGYDNYTDEQLKNLFGSSLDGKKGKDAGSALAQMIKQSNFNDIIDVAGAKNDKQYSKNAAGINAAINDLQEKIGFSDEQKEAFKSRIDSQAKKDAGKAHYSGGVKSGKDGKLVAINSDSTKPDAADENGNMFVGKFADEDQKNWTKERIKTRTKKNNLEGDIEKVDLSDMVVKDSEGRSVDFTDTQIGVFATSSDLEELLNPTYASNVRRKGKENFKAQKEVFNSKYRSAEGQQELAKKMVEQDKLVNGSLSTLDETKALAKIKILDEELFNPDAQKVKSAGEKKKKNSRGTNNNNGNDGSNGGTPAGGGTPNNNAPTGGTGGGVVGQTQTSSSAASSLRERDASRKTGDREVLKPNTQQNASRAYTIQAPVITGNNGYAQDAKPVTSTVTSASVPSSSTVVGVPNESIGSTINAKQQAAATKNVNVTNVVQAESARRNPVSGTSENEVLEGRENASVNKTLFSTNPVSTTSPSKNSLGSSQTTTIDRSNTVTVPSGQVAAKPQTSSTSQTTIQESSTPVKESKTAKTVGNKPVVVRQTAAPIQSTQVQQYDLNPINAYVSEPTLKMSENMNPDMTPKTPDQVKKAPESGAKKENKEAPVRDLGDIDSGPKQKTTFNNSPTSLLAEKNIKNPPLSNQVQPPKTNPDSNQKPNVK